MADLTDQRTAKWNADLVKKLYNYEVAMEIVNIPLSRQPTKDKSLFGPKGYHLIKSLGVVENNKVSSVLTIALF